MRSKRRAQHNERRKLLVWSETNGEEHETGVSDARKASADVVERFEVIQY